MAHCHVPRAACSACWVRIPRAKTFCTWTATAYSFAASRSPTRRAMFTLSTRSRWHVPNTQQAASTLHPRTSRARCESGTRWTRNMFLRTSFSPSRATSRICSGPAIISALLLAEKAVKSKFFSNAEIRIWIILSSWVETKRFGHVFNAETGTSTGEIMGTSKPINSVDFKPNRPFRAVVASEDNSICFFEGPPFKWKRTHNVKK